MSESEYRSAYKDSTDEPDATSGGVASINGSSGAVTLTDSVTDNGNGSADFRDTRGNVVTLTLGAALADAVAPAADDAAGDVGTSADAAREDHKHPLPALSGDAGQNIELGSDDLYLSPRRHYGGPSAAFTGAAPDGASGGTADDGTQFFVDPAGDWQPVPVVSVDVNTTSGVIAGLAPTNPLTQPVSAPAAPGVGDQRVEYYDDAMVRWSWNGATWLFQGKLQRIGYLPERDPAGADLGTFSNLYSVVDVPGDSASLLLVTSGGIEQEIS